MKIKTPAEIDAENAHLHRKRAEMARRRLLKRIMELEDKVERLEQAMNVHSEQSR